MDENNFEINSIELEKIEQEALISAAQIIAKNPHADLNIERNRIVQEKIEELKKQRKEESFKEDRELLENEYQKLLDEFHKAVQQEFEIWKEEDRKREEERLKRLDQIAEKIGTSRGLELKERERFRKELQEKQRLKEYFTQQVKLSNVEASQKEDTRKVYKVFPEDFEKLSKRRKEMLEKIENKPETEKERKIRLSLEKLDTLAIECSSIKKEEDKEENKEEKVSIAEMNRKTKGIEKYQNIFDYYQDHRRRPRKDLSKNIIKGNKSNETVSFMESLKSSVDHKKALEEVERKKGESQNRTLGIIRG